MKNAMLHDFPARFFASSVTQRVVRPARKDTITAYRTRPTDPSCLLLLALDSRSALLRLIRRYRMSALRCGGVEGTQPAKIRDGDGKTAASWLDAPSPSTSWHRVRPV